MEKLWHWSASKQKGIEKKVIFIEEHDSVMKYKVGLRKKEREKSCGWIPLITNKQLMFAD